MPPLILFSHEKMDDFCHQAKKSLPFVKKVSIYQRYLLHQIDFIQLEIIILKIIIFI